jgi:hypothetical protein
MDNHLRDYLNNSQEQEYQEVSRQDYLLLEQAQTLLAMKHSKGWQILQSYLLNLPKYPNPSNYREFENLMIEYTKAYGTAEAIRMINLFMEEQETIVKNIQNRINEQKSNQSS